MWPTYLLFNKREDEEASVGKKSDLIESYPCEQSLRDGKCHLSGLPCSHFVEVSASVYMLAYLTDNLYSSLFIYTL